MRRLTITAATLDTLNNLDDFLEVCDESGNTLGYFHPLAQPNDGSRTVRSPFTDEELQRRRQQRTGSPLAEVLKRVGTP